MDAMSATPTNLTGKEIVLVLRSITIELKAVHTFGEWKGRFSAWTSHHLPCRESL